MFNNINLTTKILASMVIIILGMGIISISSYIGFSKIGSEIEEIAEYQIPISTLITEVEKDILEEEILTYRFIIACKDVQSEEFKEIEKHIMKLEAQTEKAILDAENMVMKAIDHDVDEKTKDIYKLFLRELKILEKEQLVYKDLLFKLDKEVKEPDYNRLTEDTKILEKQLKKMDKNVINLMKKLQILLVQSTQTAEKDEKQALLIIEIISIIVVLIAIVIAVFLTRFIKKIISEFQVGVLKFFSYLNKETDNISMLDDSREDEIGTMAKVVNENIIKTQQNIEDDKKVIADTVLVLSDFEQGDLSKRVNQTSSNEALKELTKLLNQMGENLEKNIDNILKILSQYSQDNYLNEVNTNKLKEHFLKLANGINTLGHSISDSLVQNKASGENLQDSANTLKTNMTNLSASSLDAATSLEETAAALEEITRTMESNTENIAKMSQYATQVTNSASTGEKLVTDTMNAMDEINEQTQSIAEAITIIDQIAFQTNILSLNAAVEAATAGEYGKGFAVVAQEVRNLATRSAEAAKEIKVLVETATTKADAGKNISNKMLEEYQELNKGIAQTMQLIKNVDEASKEQQLGVNQINDAVSILDRQTQQNSAIATEASEIASNTQKLSSQMLQEVNQKEFKGK